METTNNGRSKAYNTLVQSMDEEILEQTLNLLIKIPTETIQSMDERKVGPS